MRRARLGGWGEAPAGELTFTGGVGWAGCLSIRRFFCVSEARLVVSNFGHFPPLRKYLLTPELFSPLLNFFWPIRFCTIGLGFLEVTSGTQDLLVTTCPD